MQSYWRVIAFSVVLLSVCAFAQQPAAPAPASSVASSNGDFEPNHDLQQIQRQVDELAWYHKLGDIADIDIFCITSSKPVRTANSTGYGAGNAVLLYARTFTPKRLSGKKAPVVLFVHGGIHMFFESTNAHIVRELLNEGYVVVAPEYRGSTGFGKEFFDQIDYGGAEIDDTHDVRDWAAANLPQVDSRRVGIIGWSHGGYHALLNIFRWPKDYQAAYAGVPVSDLVMRLGYKGAEYSNAFAQFVGKNVPDDTMEYRRRSPVYHAARLDTPLLVHTNTTDPEVNVMEVEHLINALKAAGKQFQYKIYENAPGGHHFNLIDTEVARQSRREMLDFLGKYLKK